MKCRCLGCLYIVCMKINTEAFLPWNTKLKRYDSFFLAILTFFLRFHAYFPDFISHNPEFTSCKLDNISEAFWGFCFVHHKIKNNFFYLYIIILRKKSELRDINSEFRLFSHNFEFTSSNSAAKNRSFPHNSDFFHNSRVYTLKKI